MDSNIIFFMVDQLSAKWLEVDGLIPTPNIDALKKRGTSFTNTISSNPLCCPARATLATGLSTRNHGVLENGYQLDPELPTFMRILQQNGWHTGALGKVHFHPHFAGLYPDYKPYGFDVAHITEDARGGEWIDWVEKKHPEHYESVLATIWPTKIPDFAEYGPNKINLRDRIDTIRKNHTWPTPEHPKNAGGFYTLPFPEEVSQTNWITGHSLDFIQNAPSDQPIYAHISYVQPHGPFHPPADYLQHVNTDAIPDPVIAEWVDDPNAPSELKRRTPICPDDWEYARQLYFADIVHLDDQLGLVMDVLRETDRLDNTYIIFLSDHGELLYDHGFNSKAEKHYDACIRVPLVISGPGLQKDAVCDEFIQLEDLCPTVLDMANQQMPAIPAMGPYLQEAFEDIEILPGRSLLPLCRGEQVDNWRNAAYCESYNNINSTDPEQWARTIRTHDFRYTFYPNSGEQMFDLKNDPNEINNIVADESFASIRDELRSQLMTMIVMQDYPKTRRDLFAIGVH